MIIIPQNILSVFRLWPKSRIALPLNGHEYLQVSKGQKYPYSWYKVLFCHTYPGSLKSSISPLQFFFFFKVQGMYFLKIFDISSFSFSTRLFPLSVLIGALGIEKPTEKCESGNTSSDGFPGLIKTLRSIWVINSSEQNLRVAEKFLKKRISFLKRFSHKILRPSCWQGNNGIGINFLQINFLQNVAKPSISLQHQISDSKETNKNSFEVSIVSWTCWSQIWKIDLFWGGFI